jgi:hypothetical protein
VTGGTPAVETVSSRTIPRYRGEPAAHRLRWSAANRGPEFIRGGLIGECDCGRNVVINGEQTVSKLVKAERQHAGKT